MASDTTGTTSERQLSVDITLQQGDFALQAAFDTLPGITVITGPSGAGKSTLMSTIAGAIHPDGGRITLGDRVFDDCDKKTYLRPAKRRIGYVLQDSLLFPHLSVRQNMLYGHGGNKDAPWSLEDVARIMQIDHLLDRNPHQLSGGEGRRVAIGRALLSGPDILLLDEPLANLDSRRRLAILPLIERLRDEFGLPIVYVTHAWPEIIRLADMLVIMEAGRITAQGPLADVLADTTDLAALGLDGSVVEATIVGHDEVRGLTTLTTPAGAFYIARIDDRPGQIVRLFIKSGDVALALRKPGSVSVQNILRAGITGITPRTPPHVDVALELDGGQSLRARITTQALENLALHEGMEVFAMVKSVALDRDLLHHPL